MAEIINVKNLSYAYQEDDPKLALDNVSFSVNDGEWIAIVGHNGSGKSTLAKSLNGILVPDEGEIFINQEKLTDETVWHIRDEIGMIFQNPENQFVGSTVADDVAFGLENHQVNHDEMVRRVQTALEQVGMSDFADHEPSKLSGGQKQRVALAGVLVLEPKIIILDESTSMLDPLGRQEMLDLVADLRQQYPLTVLSITHDINEAAQADRLLVMDDGQLVTEADPRDIFEKSQQLVEMGLDVPFSSQLAMELKKLGVAVPDHYLTNQEMEAWVWQSLSKG
ncbi:energy-coupling factor ABC transporter ATP-binding protein [Levilactobacillus bambusae]|uniref:Energy-coupling factor ABC transporter ATP-binding protein n=1 Tax=Levilactobacillus bambusae TaxID=2024736 RepID=A0A2V1N0K4_9LACO|nr:energy-coupling factor ABC transporter ATP-binding protein [Levilactobacillus bambusae]PWF99954.1 energy-coupling factor ABC transporter ATP-binding protein [Levilactobacillus bambusae]